MEKNSKLQIYKGIIQYLLESTNYTLKNIADLSHASISSILSIYFHNLLPNNFESEMHLLKLYQIILEIDAGRNKYCSAESIVIYT